MRISRLFRTSDVEFDDDLPLSRVVLWATIWAAIFVGIALYFKYAKLMTPLLG